MRTRLVFSVLALMSVSFPALATPAPVDTFRPTDPCGTLGATHMADDNTGLVICALNNPVVSTAVDCTTPAGGGCTWKAMSGGGQSMVSGWPDAIKCNVTAPDPEVLILYSMYMPLYATGWYYYLDISNSFEVLFDAAGNYSLTNITSDCTGKTIAQLKAAGQAFNFVN
ncbi:MAG: hypothetical protein PHY92_00465 [Alphaproteobacteria bacterium]|nr:hypothetical protein [Alphaproteobacteria bacterium]